MERFERMWGDTLDATERMWGDALDTAERLTGGAPPTLAAPPPRSPPALPSPAGYVSRRHCAIDSVPQGASVWSVNLFGELEPLGVTPVTVDRPLSPEVVVIKAPGHRDGQAWLISSRSHQSCQVRVDLTPA